MKAKALACLIVMLVTGCAIGPDYRPPKPSLPLPTSWVGVRETTNEPSVVTDGPADLARWWQQFGDPTLTELVEEALGANLSLALAKASLMQARAVRGIAAGGLWPSATASAVYQRQAGPPYTNGGPRNLYQAGFDAAWELDFFGSVRRNVESAGANVQAAIENLRDVQVSLAAEVALDYVQLRGYQQEIVTARNNLKVQQQTADITRKLHKVGFNSGLDLANAESIVATTE
ncbi:MAG: TolC family protein, partial [Syntrophorhabdales bacterium]